MRHPVLFVSHGSPMLALLDSPARDFLRGLRGKLGQPRAVLVVSAHWENRLPLVSIAARPKTIHDFRGFPEPLYQMIHPALGAPEIASEVAGALLASGFQPGLLDRGLDHGAWIPLKLMDPDATLPVLQLSVLAGEGAEAHYRLGQALAPLRDRGILILASGALTHNLPEIFRGGLIPDRPVEPWSEVFADWVAEKVAANDIPALLAYRDVAPEGRRNHPTEEHFVPLMVALGAAAGETGTRIHASHEYGALHMDAYRFGTPLAA